jgi:hypothetical protein
MTNHRKTKGQRVTILVPAFDGSIPNLPFLNPSRHPPLLPNRWFVPNLPIVAPALSRARSNVPLVL